MVYAGMNILYKLLSVNGVNLRILIAYRMLFATAFMVPLALIFERGTLAQNLYFESFAFTSATFAVAMSNLNPAITFVLATSVGLEKPAVGTLGGMTRIAGTVVGIGAALICTMSFLQSIVFALCTERDWSQWKLSWDLRLLTAAYSGIVCSGVVVAVIAWCIQARGPMFISIFNPLSLVIVALVGSLVLEEELHLGSILGATLIVCGLYMVLWGKSREMKMINQPEPSKISQESQSQSSEIATASAINNNNYGNNRSIKNISSKGLTTLSVAIDGDSS
nr:wat1-related protein [Quercus suber]